MRNIIIYNKIFTSGLDKDGSVLSDATPAGSYSGRSHIRPER